MITSDERRELLLALGDSYESGRTNRVVLLAKAESERPDVKEVIADLRSRKLIVGLNDAVRLTDAGYAHFKDEIAAMRRLP